MGVGGKAVGVVLCINGVERGLMGSVFFFLRVHTPNLKAPLPGHQMTTGSLLPCPF